MTSDGSLVVPTITMKFFMYCRKSSEAEDRQILSIDSQEQELVRAFGNDPSVEIVEIIRESASAKSPGRPLFERMLGRIEAGEAQGILAWHPDRLARNSIDGGRIIYLLDRTVLKAMRFSTQTFENNSQGKFMLAITFGYSKYYVDSLSENVKRGNRAKLAQGWRPNQVPLGYLNDKTTKTVVRDPVHFPLVRKIFELVIDGSHSPKQIAILARDEWGFRTPKKKRIGGNPLAMSTIYRMLSNPFYAGLIEWAGETYQGKHEPVVSIAEFDTVQRRLGRPSNARPKRLVFAFTGLIRCGECGLRVTAERKTNRYGKRYVYYHCSKRSLGPRCSQPSIELKALEAQVVAFLRTLEAPEVVRKAALKRIESRAKREKSAESARRVSLDRAIASTGSQLEELTGMRLRRLITDEEFSGRRVQLTREKLRLEESAERVETVVNRFEPLRDLLLFRNRAAEWFLGGDEWMKRRILRAVGSNLTLTNKILSIEAAKPFQQVGQPTTIPDLLAVVEDVRTFLASGSDEALELVEEVVAIVRENEKENRPSVLPRRPADPRAS